MSDPIIVETFPEQERYWEELATSMQQSPLFYQPFSEKWTIAVVLCWMKSFESDLASMQTRAFVRDENRRGIAIGYGNECLQVCLLPGVLSRLYLQAEKQL